MSYSGSPCALLWQPHPSSWLHGRHWLATIEVRHEKRSLRGAFSNAFCSDHYIERSLRVHSPFAPQVSLPRLLLDSCANVCEALEHAGIYRIVVLSTAGFGEFMAQPTVADQGIQDVGQHQARARGSWPRKQGDSADEDGLEAALRQSEAEADRHEDGRANAGQ